MKLTKVKLALVPAILGMAASQASANLVVNGDFESGNSGFTSGYEHDSSGGGLAVGGEGSGGGKYAVGTDPKFFHSGFTSFGDHTSGTGNMMVVNGSFTAGKKVWEQTIAPPLVVGSTYEFSAWVANVYPVSPASLEFSVNGTALGTFSATGSGTWHKFTATFVAAASTTASAVDLNLAFSGNDFALDDISITVVPEPSTYVAGGLALLPLVLGLRSRLLKK